MRQHLERFAKDNELDLFIEYKDDMIAKSMEFLNETVKPFEMLEDPEQQRAVYRWQQEDNTHTMFKMIARLTLYSSLTAQSLVGIMHHRVKDNPHADIIIDIMLNAVLASGLVTTKRVGMYIMFYCKVQPSKAILDARGAMGYVMPSIELPLRVESNDNIGYRTVNESLICGGPLKHHNKPLNLDHINKVNRNAYRIETRVLFLLPEPTFDYTPKLLKTNNYETKQDIASRKKSWDTLMAELPVKRNMLLQEGNMFYIHHKYDNGGRTYAKAYHFNYQGIAHLKAQIQSHHKEMVEPKF